MKIHQIPNKKIMIAFTAKGLTAQAGMIIVVGFMNKQILQPADENADFITMGQ